MYAKKVFLSWLAAFGLLAPLATATDNLTYLKSINEDSPIILKHDLTVQSDKYIISGLNNSDNMQNYYHYSHSSHSSHASHRSHYSSRY